MASPLNVYFTAHATFLHNPSAPAVTEFDRLCQFFHWPKDSEDWKAARKEFGFALTNQFNFTYGTDVHDYASWRRLCEVLHISPIPDTVAACKKAIESVFVNIVDLVDTSRTGNEVVLFESEQELSEYTTRTNKIFPRNEAKAGGLLRFLLRQIFSPGSGAARRNSKKRRN